MRIIDWSSDVCSSDLKALLGTLTLLGLEDRQSLMLSIGTHSISDADVMEALIPVSTMDADHHPHVPQQHRAIPIRGLTPGVALKLSECCHPVPGDRIVGLRPPA